MVTITSPCREASTFARSKKRGVGPDARALTRLPVGTTPASARRFESVRRVPREPTQTGAALGAPRPSALGHLARVLSAGGLGRHCAFTQPRLSSSTPPARSGTSTAPKAAPTLASVQLQA